jgi:hypothetical protein
MFSSPIIGAGSTIQSTSFPIAGEADVAIRMEEVVVTKPRLFPIASACPAP